MFETRASLLLVVAIRMQNDSNRSKQKVTTQPNRNPIYNLYYCRSENVSNANTKSKSVTFYRQIIRFGAQHSQRGGTQKEILSFYHYSFRLCVCMCCQRHHHNITNKPKSKQQMYQNSEESAFTAQKRKKHKMQKKPNNNEMKGEREKKLCKICVCIIVVLSSWHRNCCILALFFFKCYIFLLNNY